MSQWIDVKQELPSERHEVLVWIPFWHSRPFIGYRVGDCWFGEHILSDYKNLEIHWMPLPDPPTEVHAVSTVTRKESK